VSVSRVDLALLVLLVGTAAGLVLAEGGGSPIAWILAVATVKALVVQREFMGLRENPPVAALVGVMTVAVAVGLGVVLAHGGAG